MIFGSKDMRYKLAQGWGDLPDRGKILDIPGISIDSKDRVYVLSRDHNLIYMFNSEGRFLGIFGDNLLFERLHGIYIDSNDFIYIADDNGQVVKKYSSSGELLLTLGSPGVPSPTGCLGYDYRTIKKSSYPFHNPTNIAVTKNGKIFVSDGYGNARVHKFSQDGELLFSWGNPGENNGQFNLPHDIAISNEGKIFVADRENSRIQIFDQDGTFLDKWINLNRPSGLHIDKDDNVYVAELGYRAGRFDLDYRNGFPDFSRDILWSRISIYNSYGNLISRWGDSDFNMPGSFLTAHCVCTDSKGDLYVGEVLKTIVEQNFTKNKVRILKKERALQKFERQF